MEGSPRRWLSYTVGMKPLASWILRTTLVGVLASSAACGDTEDATEDTGGDTADDLPPALPTLCETLDGYDSYEPGIVKVGEAGYQFTLVSSEPGPPLQGDNIWVVDIVDPEQAPVAAATDFSIVPWMPDHGHGTNVQAEVTPMGEAGRFEIGPVNLWMPGVWTVDVVLNDEEGRRVDEGVFAFCIEA